MDSWITSLYSKNQHNMGSQFYFTLIKDIEKAGEGQHRLGVRVGDEWTSHRDQKGPAAVT